MAENAGGAGTAAVDSSPSLADFVGEMYGDYSTVASEPDDALSSAPESSDPSSSSTAQPEGSEASAPAAAPAAEAEPHAKDGDPDSASPEVSEPDPLDGAQPLAYTVDGQARTYEGVTVLKDGGAIIDPEKVADIQRRLGERDHLFEKDQSRHQQFAELERLTTWQQKDAQGQVTTLTGREAIQAKDVVLAQALATITTWQKALTDPEAFANLVDVQQTTDGNFQIVPSKQGMALLKAMTESASLRAAQSAQSRFSTLAKPPAPVAPTPAERSASITSHAAPTVQALITQHSIAGLTPTDQAFLVAEFPRYVITNPDQSLAVDPRFVEVMQDRAALRAEQAKVATTVSTASAANAAKLAAASVGRGVKAPPKINGGKPIVAPVRSRADDFDDMYDRAQAAAAGALRGHTQGL